MYDYDADRIFYLPNSIVLHTNYKVILVVYYEELLGVLDLPHVILNNVAVGIVVLVDHSKVLSLGVVVNGIVEQIVAIS